MNDNSHTTTNSSFPPSDWVETTLGEVCEIKTESINPKESATFFNVYSLPGFDNNKLPERLKSDEIKSNKYILKEKCILFSKLNPKTSRVWRVESVLNKNICSTEFIPLVVKDNIVNNFFYYFLNSPFVVNTLGKSAGGTSSSHQRIRPNQLLDLPIFLPPLLEQQAISSVLSSFDDKIELLREENKTLEEMGQTIYKEWFGKYSIEKTEELPEGWRIGKLGEVVDLLNGFAYKSSNFVENGKYRLVTIANVQDGYFLGSTKDGLDEIPQKMPNYCSLKTGDILLSLTGNVGRVCHVVGENYFLNQRVAKLQAKEKKNYGFIYTMFRQNSMIKLLESISAGTAQQNLSPIKTSELEIIIPLREILNDFANTINPMIDKILNNKLQIQSLAHSRDEILPKLISGQVRVNLQFLK